MISCTVYTTDSFCFGKTVQSVLRYQHFQFYDALL